MHKPQTYVTWKVRGQALYDGTVLGPLAGPLFIANCIHTRKHPRSKLVQTKELHYLEGPWTTLTLQNCSRSKALSVGWPVHGKLQPNWEEPSFKINTNHRLTLPGRSVDKPNTTELL